MYTSIRQGQGVDIIAFIASELIHKVGHTIPSKDLYARYRQWSSVDISDVKLAETFGKYINNKRVSSGRVWLDYKFVDQSWTAPISTDEYEAFIALREGKNVISTRFFAPMFKDLTMQVPDDVYVHMSLQLHNDTFGGIIDNLPTVHIATNRKPIIPGLWFINPTYGDIMVCITVAKSCMARLSLTRCNDTIPSNISYSNTADIEHLYRADFSIISGRAHLRIDPSTTCIGRMFKQMKETPVCSGTPTELTICGWRGVSYPSCDGTLQLLQTLVQSGADFAQSTVHLQTLDKSVPYIEHDVDKGYRYCLKITLVRDFDMLHNIKLTNLPIPESMLTVTLNDQPYSGQYVILCSDWARCNTLDIVCKVNYYVSELPESHILQFCKLTATAIDWNTPIRSHLKTQPCTAETLDMVLPLRCC